MNKKMLVAILVVSPFFNAESQSGVGIGITLPDSSAILHIQNDSDPKGLLIPRYDEEGRDNINSSGSGPANGLIIYNTDDGGFNYFNGVDWLKLVTAPELEEVDESNLDRNGSQEMEGNLNMNNYEIRNLQNGEADGDAVNFGQLDALADRVDALEGTVESLENAVSSLEDRFFVLDYSIVFGNDADDERAEVTFEVPSTGTWMLTSTLVGRGDEPSRIDMTILLNGGAVVNRRRIHGYLDTDDNADAAFHHTICYTFLVNNEYTLRYEIQDINNSFIDPQGASHMAAIKVD